VVHPRWISHFSIDTAEADGGNIRGVQLAGHCQNAVVGCDTGGNDGDAVDKAARAAGGGDIRGFPFTGHCKHVVGMGACDIGGKDGAAVDGAAGAAGVAHIRGVQVAGLQARSR
jgi:hypothetical protein